MANSEAMGTQDGVLQPVEWLTGGAVRLVDQTLLPQRLEYVDCGYIEKLAECIRSLKVRGAPAIGVAAAYGLCLAAGNSRCSRCNSLARRPPCSRGIHLRATRPTAVNLPPADGPSAGRSRAGSFVLGRIR